jgi:hypothetical protein
MWGEEKARGMLREAGVTKVEVEQLLCDFTNNYFIITKNQVPGARCLEHGTGMPHGLVSPLEKVAMRKLKPCLIKLRLREVSRPRMNVFDLIGGSSTLIVSQQICKSMPHERGWRPRKHFFRALSFLTALGSLAWLVLVLQ